MSLPTSEMHALMRHLTGHAMPSEVESGRKLGAAGKASMAQRRIAIAADVRGTIDKTDLAAEKGTLRQHGYFANEDPGWAATRRGGPGRLAAAR